MAGILSAPAYFLSVLVEKGVIHLLTLITSYSYLTIHRFIWKKRLDIYDLTAVGQPEKHGFFIPKEENELETPRTSTSLEKYSDDVFMFGSNSKAQGLAIHVARIPDNQVKCSVFLRLSNGKLYSLPREHSVQRASSEDGVFGSSRLKLQCLSPMRKWRVFFNGILREFSDDEKNTSAYKHVKFTFLWSASSEIFDFSSDMSKPLLSETVAKATSWKSIPAFLLQKLHAIFDRYEQSGMFFGTLQVEDEPEEEIYLWGCRGRSLGQVTDLRHSKYTEVYGNFKNGSLIHLGLFNIPGVVKRFVYGYVMRSDGFVFPIDELDDLEDKHPDTNDTMIVKCLAGGHRYDILIQSLVNTGANFQKEFGGAASIKTARITMNEHVGNGFVFKGVIAESERMYPKRFPETLVLSSKLTIPFGVQECQSSELTGGKGASLGKLFVLANQSSYKMISKFTVPNGVVVSTTAYESFTKAKLERILNKFEEDVWASPKEDISQLCEKTVKCVNETELPEEVINSIKTELKTLFGDSYSLRKFAVRSSATGEDTEQMSAAGQMETFLGVKGIKEIANAVIMCWGSQFTFQAVQYKRRYGQRLNTPMAVVIQEMVPCDVAGVIFTCDPVSGNPSFISITANWGLGESVVSASAEPDTITLERDVMNKVKFHSKVLGKKKSKVIMNEDMGTKEIEVDDSESSVCCISDSDALRLGQMAISIENEYGSPRDIEWGMAGGNIFLFQSRPVTSLDIATDFETEHAVDSALRCEREVFSRAHVGEAMPGSASVLGLEIMAKLTAISNNTQVIRFDGDGLPDKPYIDKGAVTAYYTVFFNLVSGIFKFGERNDDFTKAMVVAFFGRLIEDKEICIISKERHSWPKKFNPRTYIVPFYIVFVSYFGGFISRRMLESRRNFQIPYKSSKSSRETLLLIGSLYDKFGKVFQAHMNNSFASTFWNSSLLTLLAKSEGEWDNVVYGDFAYLLSTCTEVESANVPAALQELAFVISKEIEPSTFKSMSPEEALKWIQSSTSDVGIKYKQFIKRHGARCIKEFDVYSQVWETNPLPLIKCLQESVNDHVTYPTEKKIDSFSKVFSNLKIRLSFIGRLQLRWSLPRARDGVRNREYSKSVLIEHMNRLRKAWYHMANQMVLEGRLPKKEHMFFLNLHELDQLTKTRSPSLVSKAARRFNCHEKMDRLIFEEIIFGIPKPINQDEIIPTGKGFSMTGVPVSRGVVKAKARVITNIKDASSIQQGEILITYSTDIAWSPYFPLLAGVVTELGGLISHGAVVAREYGLPCVVALHGATRAFKSGDIVILDGNKGLLQKVEED